MAQQIHGFRVLVFDPEGELEKSVLDIFADTPCDVVRVRSSDSLHRTFTYPYPFDAVVMNLSRRDDDILDMIPSIRKISPKAEIFVLSRCADERLWLDVLDRGAHDLFLSPPDRAEFLGAVLQSAQAQTPAGSMCPADAA